MNAWNSGSEVDTLKDQSSHFAFGENWASYVKQITGDQIREAEKGLIRLLGENGLQDKTFLDIGSGSGLHSLAALNLGASRVVSFDIDPVSVNVTRQLLENYVPTSDFHVQQLSVFDLSPETFGLFDVVYSWGVLHHTGAMDHAVARAAATVKPDGIFAIALYRKTRLCGFWKLEKRWYSRASRPSQKIARILFVSLTRAVFRLQGRSFAAYISKYKGQRGMDYWHDVHDWLGGYPYESITPEQVEKLFSSLGFERVTSVTEPLKSGLLGSGCDEYVYRERAHAQNSNAMRT